MEREKRLKILESVPSASYPSFSLPNPGFSVFRAQPHAVELLDDLLNALPSLFRFKYVLSPQNAMVMTLL